MNNNINPAELDSLVNELEFDICIVSAIQVAIECGPYDAKQWNLALIRAVWALEEVQRKLNNLVEVKE